MAFQWKCTWKGQRALTLGGPQGPTHLQSWCLWRELATCSGCCEVGGGVAHQTARLHLSLPQRWGWWEVLFGSATQTSEERRRSSLVALSPCSGTWRSRSVSGKETSFTDGPRLLGGTERSASKVLQTNQLIMPRCSDSPVLERRGS